MLLGFVVHVCVCVCVFLCVHVSMFCMCVYVYLHVHICISCTFASVYLCEKRRGEGVMIGRDEKEIQTEPRNRGYCFFI